MEKRMKTCENRKKNCSNIKISEWKQVEVKFCHTSGCFCDIRVMSSYVDPIPRIHTCDLSCESRNERIGFFVIVKFPIDNGSSISKTPSFYLWLKCQTKYRNKSIADSITATNE